MEIKKNNVYEVLITDITSEGSGVCRIDGYTVFVPDTAVGDQCIISILKVGKSFGYGKLTELLHPSADRVEPLCKLYAKCGGCTYQHIDYKAECAIKQKVVSDAFERIGGFTIKVKDIVGSNQITGYRNKAQYPVAQVNGSLCSGFFARHSHRIIGNGECLLQPKLFYDIHAFLIRKMNELSIAGYDETNGSGTIRHIYLRQAKASDEIMLCLVSTCKDKRLYTLANAAMEQFPEIKSVVLNINSNNTNVILGKQYLPLCGKDYITDILCDTSFELSAASFYQVNHDQAEQLYNIAYSYAGLNQEMILLDLYCGVGTIGLAAAKRVKKLIGVEIIPQAIENAKRNAKRNGINNARFICGDAGQAARELANEKLSPDVIIVDPPRKGIDANVIEAIELMKPKKVVMVSCNPSTAARDCKLLCEKGYSLCEVTPVDMFPRTTHVECVVLMKRV